MSILYILALVPKIGTGTGANSVDVPTTTANELLWNALNLTYFAAGIVAVIVIILSGYWFATAVYDPAKIVQAKNAMLYAVVGLICVIFAFVITQFIMGRF